MNERIDGRDGTFDSDKVYSKYIKKKTRTGRTAASCTATITPHQLPVMDFEVIAQCHTTNARVCRMKLARESF